MARRTNRAGESQLGFGPLSIGDRPQQSRPRHREDDRPPPRRVEETLPFPMELLERHETMNAGGALPAVPLPMAHPRLRNRRWLASVVLIHTQHAGMLAVWHARCCRAFVARPPGGLSAPFAQTWTAAPRMQGPRPDQHLWGLMPSECALSFPARPPDRAQPRNAK